MCGLHNQSAINAQQHAFDIHVSSYFLMLHDKDSRVITLLDPS